MLTLRIESPFPLKEVYRFLWAKHVKGFNPSKHCAQCLIGHYENAFGLSMPTGVPVAVNAPQGSTLYICGVSNPYVHQNNLHLPVRVKEGATAYKRLWFGGSLYVDGAETLDIDSAPAYEQYPTYGKDYLTCRNFQFGVQHFGQK